MSNFSEKFVEFFLEKINQKMVVHISKSQGQKSQSQSNSIIQTKGTDTAPINFFNQNFEAEAQNRVSGKASTDVGVSRLSSLQNKANSSTRVTQLAEVQKNADQHTIHTKSKHKKNNSNSDNVIQLSGGKRLLDLAGKAIPLAKNVASKAMPLAQNFAQGAGGMAKTFGTGVGKVVGNEKFQKYAGRLGTGLGVGNAIHDASGAYFDEKTKGMEKLGNIGLNLATAVPGSFGSVASIAKAGYSMYQNKGKDTANAETSKEIAAGSKTADPRNASGISSPESPLHADTNELEFGLHSSNLATDGLKAALEARTGQNIDKINSGFGSRIASIIPGASKIFSAGIGLVDLKSALSALTKAKDGDASSPILKSGEALNEKFISATAVPDPLLNPPHTLEQNNPAPAIPKPEVQPVASNAQTSANPGVANAATAQSTATNSAIAASNAQTTTDAKIASSPVSSLKNNPLIKPNFSFSSNLGQIPNTSLPKEPEPNQENGQDLGEIWKLLESQGLVLKR